MASAYSTYVVQSTWLMFTTSCSVWFWSSVWATYGVPMNCFAMFRNCLPSWGVLRAVLMCCMTFVLSLTVYVAVVVMGCVCMAATMMRSVSVVSVFFMFVGVLLFSVFVFVFSFSEFYSGVYVEVSEDVVCCELWLMAVVGVQYEACSCEVFVVVPYYSESCCSVDEDVVCGEVSEVEFFVVCLA